MDQKIVRGSLIIRTMRASSKRRSNIRPFPRNLPHSFSRAALACASMLHEIEIGSSPENLDRDCVVDREADYYYISSSSCIAASKTVVNTSVCP